MNDEKRIGVFICHCGTNISHTVDIGEVVAHAASMPDVVVAEQYKYMCSDPGQDVIKEHIREDRLNRVVVGSCSPLMHEETFRQACEEAGLNRFLFQMANIREHCSWVHPDRHDATTKAKTLVAGAVRRVWHHQPLEAREVPVRDEALVVGAGIAGIEAALRIADSGKKVYLVEREPSIGGHMAKFDKTFPTLDCAACILTPKMVSVARHPNIELMTYSEVEEVSGFVGNFTAKVRRKARYVDEDKCTGCGRCIERCPVRFSPADENGKAEPKVELPPDVHNRLDRAVDAHRHERGPLVSILQDLNADLGYLPPDALRQLSRRLEIPLSRIYHVATFYTAFSLEPRGEHIIRVCMGTACHVRGAARVLETLEDRLEIRAGETSDDLKFTLETVNCLGACAMGPVMVINDEYFTVQPDKIDRLISNLGSQ